MRSMTGYAKLSFENDRFSINLEIKSVNNKNLLLKTKLPHNMNFMENHIRTFIAEYISRGTVDLKLELKDKSENPIVVSYDTMLANSYMNTLRNMEEDLDEKFSNKMDFLVKNFNIIVTNDNELDEEVYKNFIEEQLQNLINEFIKSKSLEGERLKFFFINQLQKIKANVEIIKSLRKDIVINYKNKLLANINQLEQDIKVNEEDILKEILIYSDRVDISEEVSRLESHICQLELEINSKEIAIGKKIEFILQEIFRELNTTGVKSNMYEISKLVVDTKNELEKMREQIMNIE